LEGVFATKTQAEWIEWFRGKDVCFAPVKNLREGFDDPQAQARGMRLLDEQGREHIGTPIKFRDEPGQLRFTIPAIGEHNGEVFAALGYSDAEIAALAPTREHH
jgi:crotonobetainyl-CoA:carnitine CoA-transferase CaiB-like acyl-CoA transferase